MLTNRGVMPEIAPEYGLPFSLFVIALIALFVAAPFYFIFELTREKSSGAKGQVPEVKVGHFIIGAILVVASVGAYAGFETATSSIAAKKATVEAEKQKVVEQKAYEETQKQKAEKQKAEK